MKLKIRFPIFFILFFLFLPLHAQNWQGVGNGLSYFVRDIFSDTINNLLFIGGNFQFADTLEVDGICNWNGINWSYYDTTDLVCGFGMCENIYSICNYNDILFVSGAFGQYGNEVTFLKKWDSISWQECGNPNTPVNIRIANNKLFALGIFDTISNNPIQGIAQWNGFEWIPFVNTQTINFYDANFGSVAYYKNDYYFGGNFNLGNGMEDIIRWDGAQCLPLQNGISDDWVSSLAVYKDELYVGGLFLKSNGNPGNYIARWDGNSWHEVGGGMWGGQVANLIVFNGYLYAVGQFSYAGGVYADKIARWDGYNWCSLGSTFDNAIMEIGICNNELYIGGGFLTIDEEPISYLAKWIGGSYIDTCSNTTSVDEIDNDVNNMIIYPNPISDFATLSLSKPLFNASLLVYDMLGKEVMRMENLNGKGITIFRNGMSKGMYFFMVVDGNINVGKGKMIVE